jgi:hypothetical protein
MRGGFAPQQQGGAIVQEDDGACVTIAQQAGRAVRALQAVAGSHGHTGRTMPCTATSNTKMDRSTTMLSLTRDRRLPTVSANCARRQ